MNIARRFEQAANTWPDRVALIDAATDRRLSFAEMVRGIFAFSRQLVAGFEAGPGDRVALLGDSTWDFLLASYGVMCAGRVRVSLDPALDAQELLNQLRDADARVLLYCEAYLHKVDAMRDGLSQAGIDSRLLVLADHSFLAGENECPMPHGPADAVASLNYTGGTTGQPKAVVHTHASYGAVLENTIAARAPWSGDLMLNMRPLWPIAAVLQTAHLLQGGTLILASHFDPARFWDLVERYEPTCTSLVPTHLVRILGVQPARLPMSSALRCIEVGAAGMSQALFERAVEVFGPVFSVIYGLTEAPWTCYRPPSACSEVLADPDGTAGLVGSPTKGAEVAIFDGPHRLADGRTGEVLIRGRHVMQGYWKRPELDATVLEGGWLRTGDLGSMDEQGRLRIRGRLKSVIRTGGKSVQPSEVEDVLIEHPAVREVAVVGVPDAEWGELVAAAVVVQDDSIVKKEDLVAFCRGRLSVHKRPKLILFVPALPRSHYGKVLVRKVQEVVMASRAA